MGYMGMSHWGESDEAADFVFVYQKAKTMQKRSKLIETELKNFANDVNTPGSVNIALAMEDGIVRKSDLNTNQLNKLRELLLDLKLKSSAKFRKVWGDEESRIRHNKAYKRLIKQLQH